ncbi:hypothetical protein BQ8794_10013 [Mesorhizobium prunaredense]|uniref:Uncharacterized protein n=1 Tax=Mesorhizobium prunaredense TaxID=1631249 RepID=A0A1R3UYC9_9HYPH|nr:hypothetical protein [Mesorhizobium prunaredense]SIT52643.1 hypothetical protein BQ8794_10013 [Mesorhizobium prunaredense]
MVDTVRTRSALALLFADNAAGNISAQDLRDMLASVPVLNPQNEQTGATYTFALADADQSVIFNRASAQAVTIPKNSVIAFPIGTRIRCVRKGAGLPTIAPVDGDVTLHKPTGIKPNRPMKAMVKRATDQTGANYTSETAVPWDAEVYDTDAFHDNSSNNTRLSIPSGSGIVRVHAGAVVRAANFSADFWGFLALRKDGSKDFDGAVSSIFEAGVSAASINFGSGSVPVVAGTTYFDAALQVETDTSVDIIAARSNFWVEVTEIDPVGSIAYQYGYVTLEKIGTDEWMIEGPALG